MPRRIVLLGAALLAVSGCTTDRPLPDPASQTSLIEYVQGLRRDTSTLLDRVAAEIPSPVEELPDYRIWGDFWCPRHLQVHSTDDVIRQVAVYCESKNGIYREPLCHATRDPDEILFYAAFRRNIDRCQNVAATVDVRIVEPRPGKEESTAYVQRLHQLGFRSEAEVAAERVKSQERRRMERERIAEELPLLRTKGTKVCSERDGWLYAGYVEDSTDRKIKISVADQYIVNPDGRPGVRNPQYRPESIWDFPQRWFVCEQH